MINKQSIWFVTLFSFIIVLSIYYLTINSNGLKDVLAPITNEITSPVYSEIEENSPLISLRLEEDESVLKEINDLENILIDNTKTSSEKNNAYNSLLALQDKKKDEERIEKKIKELYGIETFVKVKNNTIKITSIETKHDVSLANKIIRTVQEMFDEEKYITIKFAST